MEIKNSFIKELFENDELTEVEVTVLFEDKADYNDEKEKIFNTLLQKVIDLVEINRKINFEYINFPNFDFRYFNFEEHSINFSRSIFSNIAEFNNAISSNKMDFHETIFMDDVYIIGATFNKDTAFNKAHFNGNTYFRDSKFNQNVNFNNVIFKNKLDCTKVRFNGYANFTEATFLGDTHFDKSTFEKKAYFKESIFNDYTSFKGVTFQDYANFRKCNFKARATLRGIRSKDLVNFSNSSFYDLDLENTQFSNANYLHISGLNKNSSQKVVPTKEHFTNKESARLIKTHFEKQNNISESNKYFQIEQELYIDHLKKSTTEPNRLPTLTTLYLSKLISNFGTDWIRAILLLFGMGMVFMLIYIGLDGYLSTVSTDIEHFTSPADMGYIILMVLAYTAFYTSTFYKSEKSSFWAFMSIGIVIVAIAIFNYTQTIEIQNYIIQLTNPINALKKINLYEGLEIYGVFVRIVITIIIYQLIVAFRQHTRRK